MNLHKFFLVITLLVLSSCGLHKKNFNSSRSSELTVIETRLFQSNFSALLESKELYYLDHMSVAYDNFTSDFWKIKDTIYLGNGMINQNRKGACSVKDDNTGFGFCIEQQEHTIDPINKRVVKFTGGGSGYRASIDFVYDESGRLVEYQNGYNSYYLNYTKWGGLKDVVITKSVNGVEENVGWITFK